MLDGGLQLDSGHAAYAKKVASIFCRKHHVPADAHELFESDAYFALCRAAAKYDPAGGASFETFAFHWIRGAMCERVKQERRARDIAGKVPEMLQMTGVGVCPTFDTADREVGSDLYREGDGSFEQEIMGREAVGLLEKLPEKMRQVLRLRLLLDASWKEVATRLNLSRSRCKQLEAAGLKKLRRLWSRTRLESASVAEPEPERQVEERR